MKLEKKLVRIQKKGNKKLQTSIIEADVDEVNGGMSDKHAVSIMSFDETKKS